MSRIGWPHVHLERSPCRGISRGKGVHAEKYTESPRDQEEKQHLRHSVEMDLSSKAGDTR